MKITATNKATGEVIELDANNPVEIRDAWLVAQQYEKAAAALKDQLKELVPNLIEANGASEVLGDYQFKLIPIQRMTYDKTVMRDVLNADDYEVLLKPDKTAIDKYLAENLESLQEASTLLRKTMLPDGKAFTQIRLERIKRGEE